MMQYSPFSIVYGVVKVQALCVHAFITTLDSACQTGFVDLNQF